MQLRGGAVLFAVWLLVGCSSRSEGTLRLIVLDGSSGAPTPARVELRDASGRAFVAPGALAVAADCGWKPIHNWIGWWSRVQMHRALDPLVYDPVSGSNQFYVDRPLDIELPPGVYHLRAFKGNEYRIASQEVMIENRRVSEVEVAVERWIDMPSLGWFSADDHLHIPRPHPRFDGLIASWMAAEDLHVANLLQMGLAQDLHITPQYAFGSTSIHRRDSRLVASGQENPRTHVVGHAIVLGAPEYLDIPADYLGYGSVFEQSHATGGINGFAHWGLGGADEGLAVWAPRQLVDFLEVLGFGLAYYGAWYDLLDIGLRVTPTAGTDYPCSHSLPGRERFYTRLDGPLSYPDWLEGVRAGRTFITNGPVLELRVAGTDIGGEVALDGPASVRVTARVHFDPRRDRVESLELIRAGRVVESRGRGFRPGSIELETELAFADATWLAARASGTKLGETRLTGLDSLRQALTFLPRPSAEKLLAGDESPLPPEGSLRPSYAHTAPIYVTVRGGRSITEQPAASEAAARWLELLDVLECRFSDDRLAEMAGFPGRGDGLALEDLTSSRPGLVHEIATARAHLAGMAGREPE